MERTIRAVFLDLGGTFRVVQDNAPYKTRRAADASPSSAARIWRRKRSTP